MRALVTGATGFLGRHVVSRLLRRGDEVRAIALDTAPLNDFGELTSEAVDIRDRDTLARAVERYAPDAILHLAALSHVGRSWSEMPDYYAVNVAGTENVVAAAAGRRLLFVSSAEVYGLVPDEEQPIEETRLPAPRSPYALTKAVAESFVRAAGGIVVRSFNLVGRGQLASFALPGFAAQLAAIRQRGAEPVLHVGNLSARRDFVPVEDAAAAIECLLDSAPTGCVANLATGRSWSIAEGLERLVAIAGVDVDVVEDPARLRPVDVPRLEGAAGLLGRLGWSPRQTFDQALGEVWNDALEREEAR